MTIESFQRFVETFCPSACVPVDLVKIARNVALSNIGPRVEHDFRFQPPEIVPSPLCLVMDGECCLDRLYGGYFGDWVCGGQWNRMVEFLRIFFQVASSNNIEITVFFNGAAEPHRLNNWIEKQKSEKEKMSQVLRHVAVKGTPPPKVWWVPPNGLRTCLRILLRHLKVNVVLTTNDHHQEVMSYLKKYNYHGLLADDPEYIIFDPPRYFSSVQLKLTFKGCLETKECILNEVTRCLNLHPSRLCVVAALLGNHIISDSELACFHRTLCPEVKGKITPNNLIKAVVEFVRNLSSIDDLNEVAQLVFGTLNDERCEKFKQCVLYYCTDNRNTGARSLNFASNITTLPEKDGFEEQRNHSLSFSGKSEKAPLLPTPSYPDINSIHGQELRHNRNTSLGADSNSDCSHLKEDCSEYHSKFASETDECEMSTIQTIRQALVKSKPGAFYHLLSNDDGSSCENFSSNFNTTGTVGTIINHKDSSNSFGIDENAHELELLALKLEKFRLKKTLKSTKIVTPPLPKVSTEVMRMARERHTKGLMHPFIYQILSQGEIKIPVTFEDEIARDLPSPSLLYRPLRQMVYALLFNHHHLQYLSEQKKESEGIEEKVPEIIIKEWVWSKGNKYNQPDLVPSMPLGWPVPTISRLWFGSGPDDNKKRLQAFLTCMRSNNAMMRDAIFVPKHMILLCCVLRYIITSPEMPFIHKHELDAFLAQAVDPHLTDPDHTQKLELPLVTSRGIQLAALFMQGVEHALLVNDACGAPISWLMCCPWLFFDGKIFHRKLLKANTSKNAMELCDNKYEEVSSIEQMRSAIVEGLVVKFLPLGYPHPTHRPPPPPPPPPFTSFPPNLGIGRGRGHQRVVPRGGQLEVAGVVVGSWGPNYGQGPRSPTRSIPPQVVSVGGIARGRPIAPTPNTQFLGIGRGTPISTRSTSGHGANPNNNSTEF